MKGKGLAAGNFPSLKTFIFIVALCGIIIQLIGFYIDYIINTEGRCWCWWVVVLIPCSVGVFSGPTTKMLTNSTSGWKECPPPQKKEGALCDGS